MSETTAFMLESLQYEQRLILRLMEQAAQAHAPEASALDWALEMVVSAHRDLKAGRMDWWQAVKVYQAASNAVLECDRALYERSGGLEVLP